MPISIIGQKFTQVYKELQRRNMDRSAQTQELRVLLSTLCAILAEVEELAGELETANQAVVNDVVALASDLVGVNVAVPSQRELSFNPKNSDPGPGGTSETRDNSEGVGRLFAAKDD
jgi:hypothetical protein